MKLPPFAYLRPADIAAACVALRAHPGSKILAGGQSLLVQLMQGLVQAQTLVDINEVSDFPPLGLRDGALRIGAGTRHAELAAFAPGIAAVPLLAMAVRHIAHPAIRNRGTVCGSLAYADPGAELPACAVLLGAMFTLASADGTRAVAARDFYTGPFTTACRPDELLIEVAFPVARGHERFAFAELGARVNDPAVIGVALRADMALGIADLVLFGAGLPRLPVRALPLGPRLAPAAAAALHRAAPAAGHVRGHQARILAQRALCDALDRGPAHG